MDLERKFCRLDTLRIEDGSRIEGYASMFGVADRGGDVVRPEAYGASLERMACEGRRVKMLWQHDPSQPIGVWDEVCEDAHGLWVSGRLLTEVARGAEAKALVEAGAIDGLSIGYRTVKATRRPGGRELTELELWEVSLVTFPMLEGARVGGKSASPVREMAAALRAARERMGKV